MLTQPPDTTPDSLYISLVILLTKYTGWRHNDFNVHAQTEDARRSTHAPRPSAEQHRGRGLAQLGGSLALSADVHMNALNNCYDTMHL